MNQAYAKSLSCLFHVEPRYLPRCPTLRPRWYGPLSFALICTKWIFIIIRTKIDHKLPKSHFFLSQNPKHSGFVKACDDYAHRKTADWTVGEVGMVLRLSANRSKIRGKKLKKRIKYNEKKNTQRDSFKKNETKNFS